MLTTSPTSLIAVDVDPRARMATAGPDATRDQVDDAARAHGLTVADGGPVSGGLMAAEVITAHGRRLHCNAYANVHVLRAVRDGSPGDMRVVSRSYALRP
jgi:FAD/FMN-containing dehydrogenase